MFSVKVFRTICVKFFRSDFGRSPKEIADPAVKKNGEKKAGEGRVWKRGVSRGVGVRGLGVDGVGLKTGMLRKRP